MSLQEEIHNVLQGTHKKTDLELVSLIFFHRYCCLESLAGNGFLNIPGEREGIINRIKDS